MECFAYKLIQFVAFLNHGRQFLLQLVQLLPLLLNVMLLLLDDSIPDKNVLQTQRVKHEE